jgi:Kef-type K+ transport system membrane component KefB
MVGADALPMFSSLYHSLLDVIAEHPLASLGLLLLAGYLFGRAAQQLRLPAITGYIVGGLLVSESVSGLVSHADVSALTPITELALAFIALTIGGEFQVSKLRKTGLRIVTVTLFEALFAFGAVVAVLFALGQPPAIALLLGAIAAATAPAATVIIIRDLRARGEFVDYLYGVVAFDDAVSVLLFSGSLAIVAPALLIAGGGAPATGGTLAAIAAGLAEIGLSAVVGVAFGFLIHLAARRRSNNEMLLVTLALLLLATATATVFQLSPLIANMFAGAVLINLSARNRRVFEALEPLTPPIFALFFILAGAELDIAVFGDPVVVLLGVLYLATRFAGKFLGVTLGSLAVGAPRQVRRFLGFCLFPQAGVAIGLALTVQTTLGTSADPVVAKLATLLVNIVLFSVFINELVGPLISRFGVRRGAEMEA